MKHGVAENNQILNNHQYGISIGHQDTDNIIRQIECSGEVGITFRNKPNEGRSPHRNLAENNRIVNSGSDKDGTGIDIQGETQSVTIRGNQITEMREGGKHIGIQIGEKTANILLEKNKFSGVAVDVRDLRGG